MVHVQSKTRLAGQVLERPCVRHGGHIFSSVRLKDARNDVMLGKKLGHQVRVKKNLIYTLEAIFSVQYS